MKKRTKFEFFSSASHLKVGKLLAGLSPGEQFCFFFTRNPFKWTNREKEPLLLSSMDLGEKGGRGEIDRSKGGKGQGMSFDRIY